MPRKGSDNELVDWPERIIGRKYVRVLEKYLKQLRNEDSHGNRDLFLDDVFVVYLLAFFNPSVRSLRTIEDFSKTRQVQQHLTIRQICKSTLSDFNKISDPKRLEPIIAALRQQLTSKRRPARLAEDNLPALLDQTVAVDGTFVPAVAEVAWAIANSNSHGAVRHRARLDVRINVANWIPEAIVAPQPGQSEADSAIEHIQPGRIYIYDRGYMGFELIRAHYDRLENEVDIRSHFVTRYKLAGGNSPALCDAQDRPLSAQDRDAGVVSDRVGRFTSTYARRAGIDHLALREVVLAYEENGELKTLRLITNLLEVSASTIALLYKHRWQVELFIRWFKSFGNFGHLISHSRDGVLTHVYVTIIAVMLMYLHTGYRPSKYMFALISQVAVGAATLDEILPILRERERRSELDRQSAARRRARKSATR